MHGYFYTHISNYTVMTLLSLHSAAKMQLTFLIYTLLNELAHSSILH